MAASVARGRSSSEEHASSRSVDPSFVRRQQESTLPEGAVRSTYPEAGGRASEREGGRVARLASSRDPPHIVSVALAIDLRPYVDAYIDGGYTRARARAPSARALAGEKRRGPGSTCVCVCV